MLSDPVAEAFGLIHHHPLGENFFCVCVLSKSGSVKICPMSEGLHRLSCKKLAQVISSLL